MDLRSRIGIWRSVAMYYWKPFNKRRLMRFYSQFIGPGDLCFDVGAHLGNRTNAWTALGARVVAVEPQPRCVDFLKRKFRNQHQVHIVPKAVGSRPGYADLHISRLTPTISTISNKEWRSQINSDAWYEVKWEETVPVEIITMDTLVEEYGVPAFCKIDVENFENEVLKGLSYQIPAMSFEYYPPYNDNATDCIHTIETLGQYQYNWSYGESQKLESRNWISADDIVRRISGFRDKSQYGDIYAIIK